MRSLHRSRATAFTLVELLVVIGIIALLISVLLPSLNKARQAGNLVDCQARLQQMGQALQIYVSQNKNLLPWGVIDHTEAWTDSTLPGPSNQESLWWWMFTLSEVMNRSPLASDGLVHNLSPLFRDRDTVENPPGQRWVNHYTCNPRVFYRADIPDPAPATFAGQPTILPQDLVQRKMTNVQHPSNVFTIWDAPQCADWASPSANLTYSMHAYGIAEALDAWAWYNATALCLDSPGALVKKDRTIWPGGLGSGYVAPGKAFQKKYNIDARFAFGGNGWLSHLRFRHMNNTRLAALCLDGHVETRELGTVTVKDIYTNYR